MPVAHELVSGRDRPSTWSDRRGPIPRISHGEQHQAASAGIWLHDPYTSQGRRSVPELVFPMVAGVGFEPT